MTSRLPKCVNDGAAEDWFSELLWSWGEWRYKMESGQGRGGPAGGRPTNGVAHKPLSVAEGGMVLRDTKLLAFGNPVGGRRPWWRRRWSRSTCH
jgi:hypothetical protein